MKTGYILGETQFEYDDERYSSSGGTAPVRVYTDKSRAEADRRAMTRAWVIDKDCIRDELRVALGEYDSEEENPVEVVRQFDPVFAVHVDVLDVNDPRFKTQFFKFARESSDADFERFMNLTTLSCPFTVDEVEIED